MLFIIHLLLLFLFLISIDFKVQNNICFLANNLSYFVSLLLRHNHVSDLGFNHCFVSTLNKKNLLKCTPISYRPNSVSHFIPSIFYQAFPGGSDGKASAYNVGDPCLSKMTSDLSSQIIFISYQFKLICTFIIIRKLRDQN